MYIRIVKLSYLIPEKANLRMTEKLRGFLGSLHPLDDLFHNHKQDGSVIYRYPLIQFKVINNVLSVIGIKEGSKLVEGEFARYNKLSLGKNDFTNFETQLSIHEDKIEMSDVLFDYRFLTPWLGINQKNNQAYLKGKLDLSRVLTNNLLADLGGLGIRADRRILLKARLTKKKVVLDNTELTGFTGTFTTNIYLPDFLGTGKRKSIGYGTYEKNINI